MSHVRSTQLALKKSTTAGYIALYTCPAGHRTIVRTFAATLTTAGPANVALIVNPGGGADVVISRLTAIAQWGRVDYPYWFVLNPGDQLKGYANAIYDLSWVVAGAELEL